MLEAPGAMLGRPSAPQWISKWQSIFGTFQIECEKFWTFWKFLTSCIFATTRWILDLSGSK